MMATRSIRHLGKPAVGSSDAQATGERVDLNGFRYAPAGRARPPYASRHGARQNPNRGFGATGGLAWG